jgi:outer membrane biosynthesis protein TonB
MTLLEFLRQWQPGRLTAAAIASVVLHAALLVTLLWTRPLDPRPAQKKGDALFVELPKPEESPPPGPPGSRLAPRTAESPPAPRPAPPVAPPRPEPPRAVARPAPRPEPERRVAAAPAPSPAPRAPDPAPAPAPRAAEAPPAPRAPEPPAPAARPQPAEPQVAAAPPGREAGPGVTDIRSALGRGGAGGSGLARHGIVGEPVPLETQDPKYIDYFELIRPRIKAMWDYPCVKRGVDCERHSTQTQIVFGVSKEGRLVYINVLRPSPVDRIYDDAALIAIKLASPFPPVPDYLLQGNGLPIAVRFVYILDRGFVHFLR